MSDSTTMDPELRKSLLSINDAIASLRTDLAGRIEKVETGLGNLRHDVFGSTPPPPEGSAGMPVAKVASNASLENQAQAARLIVLEQKIDAQSAAQGVGRKGMAYLRTREGQRFIIACFTAMTTFVTACGGAYAVATGRLSLTAPPAPLTLPTAPLFAPGAHAP